MYMMSLVSSHTGWYEAVVQPQLTLQSATSEISKLLQRNNNKEKVSARRKMLI